jgi:hypothetical protein
MNSGSQAVNSKRTVIKSQKRANTSLAQSLRFYRISGKSFIFFRAKMDLLGFFKEKIVF